MMAQSRTYARPDRGENDEGSDRPDRIGQLPGSADGRDGQNAPDDDTLQARTTPDAIRKDRTSWRDANRDFVFRDFASI